MTEYSDAIVKAAEAIADAMSALSDRLAVPLNERDDMQRVAEIALRYPAKPLCVRPSFLVDFAQWQPCVGHVDLALVPKKEAAAVVFVELKWGIGTLYNCVWDAAKMGVALAGGHVTRAYLVAGAPEDDWNTNACGAELFGLGEWPAPYLLDTYACAWQKWRREVKTRPQQIVSTVRTNPVAAIPMTITGSPWQLRAAEVLLPSGWEWHVVPGNAPGTTPLFSVS